MTRLPYRLTALKAALHAAEVNSVADKQDSMRRLISRLADAENAQQPESGVILIVEDDRLTARVHADALEAIGSAIVVAEDAASAEILLRERHISIILLDLVLPDRDGRDLLLRIREAAATRDVPIIVVTARIDPATQAECYALGADTLLMKPVTPDLLVAVVAGHLDHAADLRTAGRIDRLTGLATRATLSDALSRFIPLATRNRSPLSLAMLDLDHFKAVNDTYGHAVGDEVLRKTARVIATALRTSDIPARWGGEEFCIVFPDTGSRGAAGALNKALEGVRSLIFKENGQTFSVTFSAGVASLAPGGTAAQLIAEADRLLYRAKRSGRNRVFSGEDESDPPLPRVLLAEDDDAVAHLVGKLLSAEGFDVVRQSDGENALQAVSKDNFVLAVVDLDLPVLSGYEVIEKMRAFHASARMPILVLTASAEEENIVRGFDVGANDYVTKPFLARELLARVNRLITRR